MKKILSLILCFSMLFSLTAFAARNECYICGWEIDDKYFYDADENIICFDCASELIFGSDDDFEDYEYDYDYDYVYNEYESIIMDVYVDDYNGGDEEGVYYGVVDIDDDGINELIVGFGGSMGFEIYTCYNGCVKSLDAYYSDVRMFDKSDRGLEIAVVEMTEEPGQYNLYNIVMNIVDGECEEYVTWSMECSWDELEYELELEADGYEVELYEATDLSYLKVGDYYDVTSETAYNEAIIVLSEKGIIQGYDDGTFRPGNTVTRAEAAAILTRGFYSDNIIKDERTTFSDVNEYHWASGYIMLMVRKGIVNGFTDGTFRPNDEVTYGQLVKMLVCLLGYGDEAEAYGGYGVGGYMLAAQELLLTEGIYASFNDPLTRGQVAQLVYNGIKYVNGFKF